MPRTGDLAEITRTHCTQQSGLLVQVVGEPHRCYCVCAECGIATTEYFVEVWTPEPSWFKTPGPWFMPLAWLKRIDPRDPVRFDRARHYRPITPTEAQLAAANR